MIETPDIYDHLSIRCPSLGGEVPFSYCRKQGEGKPCSRLPDCWANEIDIIGYLRSFFSQNEIRTIFLQPTLGKMDTFLKNLERVNTMSKEKQNKELLIEAINKEVIEGKISCAQATKLADEYNFPRQEMGQLLDELKIKIKNCQLGCF